MRNIDLMVKPGEKVAIRGEVGSGKSTFLAAILGEVPNINGTKIQLSILEIQHGRKCAILGLAYLGCGDSIVSEKLYVNQSVVPMHRWLVMLFQGFTWFVLCFTVGLNKLHLSKNGTVKFCYVIILYAGFLCIPYLWQAMVEKLGHDHVDTDLDNNIDYTLLQSEGIRSSDNVTPFAEAGFFSTMSFWWLNPLVKKGKEKILENDDIPELRSADQAQTCYSIYMEQMNKWKQKGSSDSPSMLLVILLCQWKAILVSGLFAFIKVLALSSSPLFLIAFIKVASGKESFQYEAYALTGGLFLVKCLESLSGRQWYFQTRLIGLQHKYQTKLMIAQDRRLKAITEALANMKVLKLYAWETHFKNVIKTLRKKEFKWIFRVLSQKGYYLVLFYSSPIVIPAVTFWTCYFLSIPLNASNVFTFLSSLRIAQEQIRMIPEVVGIFIEAKVSFSRIVKFLEAPELENTNTRKIRSDNRMDWSIWIMSSEISWDACSSSRATLRNIDLMVKPGEKVAICGEVGSGKSTLLAAILGEVPNINGTVSVFGKIAYVSVED
ncbi:hypothetical protein EZV62_023139 [Acer yangbiense]|uniref:ABC transmembrane type-1 domain-containing protein n=1 Tax=Acer yangbiense TaxID=1000413 RepID=A0A5C7H1G8_9ROSI|nr:hypothetical protein EZV62_023139 [Acer yangbiense]